MNREKTLDSNLIILASPFKVSVCFDTSLFASRHLHESIAMYNFQGIVRSFGNTLMSQTVSLSLVIGMKLPSKQTILHEETRPGQVLVEKTTPM